jgi:transcription elongation factor GreA
MTGTKTMVMEMSQAAYDELVAELNHRKTVERDLIAKEIAEARALGDLRENHAYTVAMERRENNENRINDLEDLIKHTIIVKDSASSKVVTIGRSVEIKNIDTNKSKVVSLVGSEQAEAADPREGKISIDSPIGVALNKAKIGDKVSINTPTGDVEYLIVKFVK